MNRENEYLSEESLEQLITLVEQQEMVMAPPDLKEKIVGSKRNEYRRYCFRVWTSVAAAILIVFMLPTISKRMEQPQDNGTTLMQRLGESNIFNNDDIFNFFDEGYGGR